MNWKHWLHGLGATFIGGLATGFLLIVADPTVFNLEAGLEKLLVVSLLSGLINAAAYLKQSPLPSEGGGESMGGPLGMAAFVLGLSYLCSGCAGIRQGASDSMPYIATGADLACSAVLQVAVSDEDRVEKARYIYSVAACVRSLSGGKAPTPAELGAAVALWAPEKAHWAKLAGSIQSIYADAYARLADDPKLALEVLEQIASGCEAAASRIIPAQ